MSEATTSSLADLTAAFGGEFVDDEGGTVAPKENSQAGPAAFPDLPDLAELDVEAAPVDLPGGWRLREWRQGHLMAIMEDQILLKPVAEFKTAWHRNFEVAKKVIECDGFELPTGVKVDDLLGMHWKDVEKLQLGIMAHFYNTVLIPPS